MSTVQMCIICFSYYENMHLDILIHILHIFFINFSIYLPLFYLLLLHVSLFAHLIKYAIPAFHCTYWKSQYVTKSF